MNAIIICALIDFFERRGQTVTVDPDIYYGDGCVVVPFLFHDNLYYGKFFTQSTEQSILSEVLFVDYLRESRVAVPEFLFLDGKKVFYTDCLKFPCYFYATKHIESDNDSANMTDGMIGLLIENIGAMHTQTLTFSSNLPGIVRITDYQKLIALYTQYKSLIDTANLNRYIDRIAAIGPDKTDVFPIHSDLHTANILTMHERFVAFIDFSDLRMSGFEDDLGKLMQNLIGAKGVSVDKIDYYIAIYENSTGILINRKNLYISIVYHILDRFVSKSYAVLDTAYVKKIDKILAELIEHYF